MADDWIQVQINTFTAWVNRKISRSEVDAPEVKNLFSDLSSGLALISVLHELIPDLQSPRYNKNPRMDVHKLDNLAVVFKVIDAAGVHLEFVKPRNILEGDQKMTLGLIWTLIKELDLRNALKNTGLGGGGGSQDKDAFLAWVNSKCMPLGFQVTNWTTDFQNGWAWNAIIQDLRPDLNAWSVTSPQDFVGNHQRAFDTAASEMDIPPLLRVEDIMRCPDEKSVMTYCLEFLEYEQRNAKLIGALRATANKGPDPALLAQQEALAAQQAALEQQAANERALAEQARKLAEQQAAQAAATRAAQEAQLEAQRAALAQQQAALELQRQKQSKMLQAQQAQQRELEAKRLAHQNLLAQQQQQQQKLQQMQLAQKQAMEKQKADMEAKRNALLAQQQAQKNALAQQQAQLAAQQAAAEQERQRQALHQQYQQQQQMLLMQQQQQMAMMPPPGQMMMNPMMMGGMMAPGQQQPGNITVVIKDNKEAAAPVPDTIIKGGPKHKQPPKKIDCKKCGATTLYHGPDRNGRVRCRGCSKVLLSKGKVK